jgi:hypothetical protein
VAVLSDFEGERRGEGGAPGVRASRGGRRGAEKKVDSLPQRALRRRDFSNLLPQGSLRRREIFYSLPQRAQRRRDFSNLLPQRALRRRDFSNLLPQSLQRRGVFFDSRGVCAGGKNRIVNRGCRGAEKEDKISRREAETQRKIKSRPQRVWRCGGRR